MYNNNCARLGAAPEDAATAAGLAKGRLRKADANWRDLWRIAKGERAKADRAVRLLADGRLEASTTRMRENRARGAESSARRAWKDYRNLHKVARRLIEEARQLGAPIKVPAFSPEPPFPARGGPPPVLKGMHTALARSYVLRTCT